MTILEKINREQYRRNQFLNVSREDLERIDAAVQKMVYSFGWEKEKAEEIVIDKFLACRPLIY